MGQGYKAPTGDSVSAFVGVFQRQQRQLNDLQKPPGTNISELYAQVQAALANINATVIAAINANSYDKTTIDAKDAATLSSANSFTTSTINAGGITMTNSLSASDLFTRNGPSQNITATRVAAWLQSSNGLLGTASSSIRFKKILEEDALGGEKVARAILSTSIVFYHYKAELEKRDNPDSPDYVGPDYPVSTEVGMIAERLHEAGLWPFVIYERDETEHLILGDDGQPIPFGIHYEMFSLAVLAAAQWLFARYTDLDARVATLEGKTA